MRNMTNQASLQVFAPSLAMLALGCASLASGAIVEQRAQITGGNGDGKCTIEVRVDGSAEVQVMGDRARMRTTEGQPAEWRRFVCNQQMPRNPGSFRFKGIDGRGSQQLVQAPSGNRPAIVRIDDPKGGSEGYTFDLIWRGGTAWGSSGPGGWGNQGWQGNWGNDRPGYNNGRPGYGSSGPGYGSNRPGYSGSYSEVRFSGSGNGYFRTGNNSNNHLRDCQVNIDRNGNLNVNFRDDRNSTLGLSGRVTDNQNGRLTAQVTGSGISGTMYLRMDGNRVREISMDGGGRQRTQLRWNGN